MSALLAIDCYTGRVRRYAPRRTGGALRMTDEVRMLPIQHPDYDLARLKEQLEQLRVGEPVELAPANAAFPQDHVPPGAA